jgi:hypothetical protein
MMLACFDGESYYDCANGEKSGNLYFLFHDLGDDAG